jgi:hypothetical protein
VSPSSQDPRIATLIQSVLTTFLRTVECGVAAQCTLSAIECAPHHIGGFYDWTRSEIKGSLDQGFLSGSFGVPEVLEAMQIVSKLAEEHVPSLHAEFFARDATMLVAGSMRRVESLSLWKALCCEHVFSFEAWD